MVVVAVSPIAVVPVPVVPAVIIALIVAPVAVPSIPPMLPVALPVALSVPVAISVPVALRAVRGLGLRAALGAVAAHAELGQLLRLELDQLLAHLLPRLVHLARLQVGDALLVVGRRVDEPRDLVHVLLLDGHGHRLLLDLVQVQLQGVGLVERGHRAVHVALLAQRLRLRLQLLDLLPERLELLLLLGRDLRLRIAVVALVLLLGRADAPVLLIDQHLEEVLRLALEAVSVPLLLRERLPCNLHGFRPLFQEPLAIQLRHRLALGPTE
mmetsp:Transcript_9975/g.24798  ORF Transcript_9975/g.24798 Transcript_9975/m.24798 type:complete len:269 (-) Transcript_9975:280-1086(-)